MRVRVLAVCAALCAMLLGIDGAFAQGRQEIRIGVLDYSGSEHSLAHWQATGDALNAALPGHAFRLQALDIHELDAALGRHELDFVITNPGNYAELEYRHRISRIATAEGDIPVASTLVTKQGLATLSDLAGRKLAIVDAEAFGGFRLIWSAMADVNASLPGKVELTVAGYPMRNVADAVLSGAADAGVLRACMLEELQAADPARYGALRAFATRPAPQTDCAVSSAVFPGWPFAKTPRAPPALAKQVAVALLNMTDGNLWTVPLDYQPVHDLMRKLQIGPYARTGPVSLHDFVEDYGDWLIVFAVALVFWLIYSVRIETLVRRRTRALDEANADLTREMAERVRAEEADRRHRRELDHVARLSILGEMASSIAHELNQPLSAISNYAQGSLMRIRAGNCTPEDMARASEEIAQQAERAATVIKRIRAFVRKRESQRAAVDVAALIRDTAALFEAATHRAGVEVELLLDADLPTVEADAVQLQQVLLNLVQNGIDAMAATAGDDRCLVVRSARDDDPLKGRGICISVRDFGSGLDAAAMERFAEAFHTTKPEGIGLGLALSRSIVEAHGGTLRAETPDDGPGLRVMVWLPLEQGGEAG